MTELAAAGFHTLVRGDAVPDDFVVPCYLPDRRLRISIARVGGRLYAFNGLCTCADPACPLSGGRLTGTTIMCQCHGSRFDIRTGAVLEGPATRALRVYEVQEAEGAILLRPDPRRDRSASSGAREPRGQSGHGECVAGAESE